MFGNEGGRASRSTRQSGGGVLAKVRAQIAQRAEEEAAADRAAAARADTDEEGDGEGDGEYTIVVRGL